MIADRATTDRASHSPLRPARLSSLREGSPEASRGVMKQKPGAGQSGTPPDYDENAHLLDAPSLRCCKYLTCNIPDRPSQTELGTNLQAGAYLCQAAKPSGTCVPAFSYSTTSSSLHLLSSSPYCTSPPQIA